MKRLLEVFAPDKLTSVAVAGVLVFTGFVIGRGDRDIAEELHNTNRTLSKDYAHGESTQRLVRRLHDWERYDRRRDGRPVEIKPDEESHERRGGNAYAQ